MSDGLWPAGELRLEGIPVTTNPSEATVFTCPGNIRIFETSPGSGVLDDRKLSRLPYFKGNEARHVFFDVSDNFKTACNLPILFIKCDARTWMLPHDINTIQIGWGVDDYSDCIEPPEGGFQTDVSFHGWLSTITRRESSAACINNPELRCDIACYSDFCGYIFYQPEGIRRRAAYRASMKRSRLALCPESIPGVLPYRFFEAMSAGRVPLLVSSEYVLPFTDEIDYSAFTLFCERDNAKNADKIVLEFVGKTPTEKVIEMGKLARVAWERFCDPRKWPQLHAYAVQKQMKKAGLIADEPVLVA